MDGRLFQVQHTQPDVGQNSLKRTHLIVVPLAVFAQHADSLFPLDRFRIGLDVDLVVGANLVEALNVRVERGVGLVDGSEYECPID